MDDLNFSDLTDDQLLLLIRASLREAVNRSPAVAAAAKAAALDEREKADVAAAAAQTEAAAFRARERERVAAEARERVREENAVAEEKLRGEAARAAAQQAVEKAEARDRINREWLRRAAEAVGLQPAGVTIVQLRDTYRNSASQKIRVLINAGGASRYERKHLVDYSGESNTIKTVQSLTSKKKELLAFCAEIAASSTPAVLQGGDFSWEETSGEAHALCSEA